MKKVLYVLNDCLRQYSYDRAFSMYRALQKQGEPFNLYILRIDAFSDFSPEHNHGEYNIFRLPDYSDFDGILLDINNVYNSDSDPSGAGGFQYVINALAASGKPVISIANQIPGFYYVGIDNYEAMTSVIRHLHESHGLTDFWFAMGPVNNYENQLRIKGLRDYCAAHHIPFGEDRVYQESYLIESGTHAFDALFARHHGHLPQAIICGNDHIAMGICYAAKSAGYSIPEDFLVTGFDNADVAASFSPPLTTIDQRSWSMGRVCVDVLKRIWNGESVPKSISIPTRLVLRQSSECIPQAVSETIERESELMLSNTSGYDYTYKVSAMQYHLPGCKSIEEICLAMIDCFSSLDCDGIDLVLDPQLFDVDRMLSFTGRTDQNHDIASELYVEGYPDTLKLVFQWEKGSDPRFPEIKVGSTLSSLPLNGSCSNYVIAPLHFMERTVGYLCLRNCLELMRVRVVSIIVSTVTMALRTFVSAHALTYINQVLSGVSMKDDLTGLYNRLGYHELAYPLYRTLANRRGRLAILFLDMDRLKYINDAFGHGEGDRAIKCIANVLQGCIPSEAVPVRYGGDEFLALIPDADEESVLKMISEISSGVSSLAKAQKLPVIPEFSSGFVLADPASGKTLDEYVHDADERMYREKKAKKVERGK